MAAADPSLGPHARDEGRHLGSPVQLTPAHGSVIPRQPKAMTSSLPRTLGMNAVGGVQREVFGFAPYWSLSVSPSWNYQMLTTIAYFGLDVNADGSFATGSSGWTGWNSQELVNMINQAHQAGDRVVVVIKAFHQQTICDIVTIPASTQNAINNTLAAITARSLDGVNVDFEGSADPSCPNIQSGFTNFMAQLSRQVHQRWPNAQVTADTYTGSASWDGGLFNIAALAPVVDGLFVMAYDMGFSNLPGQAAPNAPLNGWTYNDTTAVAQYLTKAPASKVILGVPYYGYKWSTTSNQPYATVAANTGATADTYSGIGADFACNPQQLSRKWDATAQSPWASWWSPAVGDPCSGNYNSWRELYYDDANSLRAKYDLVNSNNLLGSGMWALGYDGGAPELWEAIRDKFGYPWPGQHTLMAPVRVLDSRSGLGGLSSQLVGGQSFDVQIASRAGVPATGAAAAILNVTVTNASAPSYLAVYPSGSGRPTTSNLNFVAGQTIANLAIVPLGIAGKVTLFNAAGSADVIFDLLGYVSTQAATSGSAGGYRPLVAARIMDTRSSMGGLAGRLGPNTSFDLQVGGKGGVPASGVAGVVINLTATNSSSGSFLTAYPTGGIRPTASNVNFSVNQTASNRVMVPTSADGRVSIYNAAGNVDVVVDVSGWFTDGSAAAAAGQFTGINPTRILDTRTNFGGVSGPVASGGTIYATVGGRNTVPPSATAVAVNVTVTEPTAPDYLTLYPGDATRPYASDLNFAPGQTLANLVIAKLGADGRLAIFNASGSTHIIVDLLGWYN